MLTQSIGPAGVTPIAKPSAPPPVLDRCAGPRRNAMVRVAVHAWTPPREARAHPSASRSSRSNASPRRFVRTRTASPHSDREGLGSRLQGRRSGPGCGRARTSRSAWRSRRSGPGRWQSSARTALGGRRAASMRREMVERLRKAGEEHEARRESVHDDTCNGRRSMQRRRCPRVSCRSSKVGEFIARSSPCGWLVAGRGPASVRAVGFIAVASDLQRRRARQSVPSRLEPTRIEMHHQRTIGRVPSPDTPSIGARCQRRVEGKHLHRGRQDRLSRRTRPRRRISPAGR